MNKQAIPSQCTTVILNFTTYSSHSSTYFLRVGVPISLCRVLAQYLSGYDIHEVLQLISHDSQFVACFQHSSFTVSLAEINISLLPALHQFGTIRYSYVRFGLPMRYIRPEYCSRTTIPPTRAAREGAL